MQQYWRFGVTKEDAIVSIHFFFTIVIVAGVLFSDLFFLDIYLCDGYVQSVASSLFHRDSFGAIEFLVALVSGMGMILFSLRILKRWNLVLCVGAVSHAAIYAFLWSITTGFIERMHSLGMACIWSLISVAIVLIYSIQIVVSRGRPPWQCRVCGYDLRGCPSHAVECPECGEPFVGKKRGAMSV